MAVDSDETLPGGRSGVYPIPLSRETTVGFIGRTERGPIDEPVRIGSFAEFYQVFGGHVDDSFMSHSVQDFFLHGGTAAVIVRVANRATRGEIRCPAGGDELMLAARYPGSQEILRVSIDYDGIDDGDETRFNLVVQRLRRGGATVIADQELYPGISIDPGDDRFIIDALRDSSLIAVTGAVPPVRPNATPPSQPGGPVGYIGMWRTGTDGDPLTDYDLIGSKSRGTGLFAFDRGVPADILCIPPAPKRDLGVTVLVAAERVCAERRSVYILDPPWSWTSADTALAGARVLGSSSRHVLSYYPRIRPRGDRARFPGGRPACGAVAGLLAQQDARGIWVAEGKLALKTSLTATSELEPAQTAMLRRAGINGFVRGTAGQTLFDGNATLASGPGRHAYRLDQCRLLDFIVDSVEEAARFALDHFFGAATLAALERQVRQFLSSLFERGGFAGSSATQAWFARVEQGRATPLLRVGFALDRPGEFVEVEVALTAGSTPAAQFAAALETNQLMF